MKKVLKIIRNIIFGIFLVAYLSVIICVSTLVLNRNDYGYTEFGDKALLDIKEDTNSYKKGQLVITKKKLIDKLKVGDEVFVYQTNQQEKTVKIVSSTIKDINADESTPYITLDSDNSSWGQDFIAGESVKVYDSFGSIISFAESKWIFFAIFIVPCFFILLYEIYSVIVVIKFDGEEVVLEGPAAALAQGGQTNGVDNVNVVMGQNNMDALMQQINNLQNQLNVVNNQQSAMQQLSGNVGGSVVQTQPVEGNNLVETQPVVNDNSVQEQPQMVENNVPAQEQPQVVANTTPVQEQPQVVTNSSPVQEQPQMVASSAPAQEQPQVVANTTPVQEQPQVVTNSAPVQEQPQVVANTTPVQEQPQVVTNTTPVQEQPQVVTNSAPVQEQPQVVTNSAPVQEQPQVVANTTPVQEQPQVVANTTQVQEQPQVVNSQPQIQSHEEIEILHEHPVVQQQVQQQPQVQQQNVQQTPVIVNNPPIISSDEPSITNSVSAGNIVK